MQNEVWNEIGMFLNQLRCENINRISCVHLPEAEEAEQIKRRTQKEYERVRSKMGEQQKLLIENYVDALQQRAFVSEKQAYCQGYVDCIQLLAGMGMLPCNPEIKEFINTIQKDL